MIAAAASCPSPPGPLYARFLWSLIVDNRTPAYQEGAPARRLGYIVMGASRFPTACRSGQLDDLVVAALATDLFLDGIDESLLREKLEEAGSTGAYDEDVARVLAPAARAGSSSRSPYPRRDPKRWLSGRPVRRPARLRSWIEREGSTA